MLNQTLLKHFQDLDTYDNPQINKSKKKRKGEEKQRKPHDITLTRLLYI